MGQTPVSSADRISLWWVVVAGLPQGLLNTCLQLLHPGLCSSWKGLRACSCSWTVASAWRRQESSCEPGPTNLYLMVAFAQSSS